jgi:hypothetical protein
LKKLADELEQKNEELQKMKVKDRELENVMAILRARKWDHVD